MGTDVCSSLGSLSAELENAKRSLHKIDDDIKKIVQTTGRFQIDRNFQNPIDSPRGAPRIFNSNFYQENRNAEDDRQGRKRQNQPQETKTVFSRLSARPGGDSDGDEDFPSKKPRVSSQVIRELPSKQQVLKAQAGDEVSKARNRRMFGSLLGTLQKFKQEEIVLKNKEDKRAQVEKKIEEQAKQEKENEKRERQNLFAERELKKATIKALEEKMVRMQHFEKWESVQKPLVNFIETKWKPHIYWLPKVMNNQAREKYDFSRKKQEKIIEDKQQELKDELVAIEERCRRGLKTPHGSRTKTTSLSQSAEVQDESLVEESVQEDNAEEMPDEPAPKIKLEEDELKKKSDYHSSKKILSPDAIKEEKMQSAIKNGEAVTKEKRNSQSSGEGNDNHSDKNKEDDSTVPEEQSIKMNSIGLKKEDGRSSQEDTAEVNGDKTEDNPNDSSSSEDIVDKPEGESPGRGSHKYN